MALLFPVVNFQYKGKVVRTSDKVGDATLSVSRGELEEAKELGKHEKTGNWNSPLLNHCLPADKEAEEVFGYNSPVVEVEATNDERIKEIYAEFDEIGKAYDRRWALPRLEQELVKAKKEVGA